MDERLAPTRIFVLDDEPSITAALQRMLEDAGYAVTTATDSRSALTPCLACDPAVIICDLHMPGLDGNRFLAQVRECGHPALSVLLTGQADVQAVGQAVNRGHIYKFLLKPWDETGLLQVVRECVERYRLEADNRRLTAELAGKNRKLQSLGKKLQQSASRTVSTLQAENKALRVELDTASRQWHDAIEHQLGPLTYMTGYARLLVSAGERLDAETQPLTTQIVELATQLEHDWRGLLDGADPWTRFHADAGPGSADAVVRTACETSGPLFRDRHMTFDYALGGDAGFRVRSAEPLAAVLESVLAVFLQMGTPESHVSVTAGPVDRQAYRVALLLRLGRDGADACPPERERDALALLSLAVHRSAQLGGRLAIRDYQPRQVSLELRFDRWGAVPEQARGPSPVSE